MRKCLSLPMVSVLLLLYSGCIVYKYGLREIFHFKLCLKSLYKNSILCNIISYTMIRHAKRSSAYERCLCKVAGMITLLALPNRGKSRAGNRVAGEALEEVE